MSCLGFIVVQCSERPVENGLRALVDTMPRCEWVPWSQLPTRLLRGIQQLHVWF